MKNWFIKTLLTAVAVFFIAWLLPGVSIAQGYLYAFLVAVVIKMLNTLLKPVLVLLTLSATILTLGLFMWVINAVVILVADFMLTGFTVDGFWWALLFSALLSMISSFLHKSFMTTNHSENTFTFKHRRGIQNENIHTTQTGNKVYNENGKKTIIIEKD